MKESKGRILFITDTYYPDSSATTTIFRRTAQTLARLGYSVSVFPAEISGSHYSYPQEYKGVKILRAGAETSVHTDPDRYGCPVPSLVSSAVPSIEEILDTSEYDYIFSGAVAFEINLLVHLALRGRKLNWFPMSYDPYAFAPHISQVQKADRLRQELEAFKDASRIFFLNEFREDYAGSPIEGKIDYFNLPCIREISPDRTKKAIEFDSSFINCVFLGDFYYGIENTDFIFRLFGSLSDRIRLYTVGNPGDYQDTISLWEKELGSRYIRHPRISQEGAHNVMLDCDLLVSMGHDSPNMCPSKAIDFASSGKPILHISKIQDCCARKYLERYPRRHFIYQQEELTEDRVKEVEEFIQSSKQAVPLPFEEVRKLYGDFTMEALIEKIIRAFQDVPSSTYQVENR